MKHIHFFDHFKFIVKDKFNRIKEYQTEIQKEEIKNENLKLHPKLNFQLIDIDKAFEN